jgi:predicted nucleic acid-binding Zn ribbon protein
MTLRRHSPRPISGALAPLRDNWAPESLLAEIQEVWPRVVGQQVAAAAAPVTERAGTLTVRCSEAGWAHELDLMSMSILTRLNEQLRRGSVTRLRCLVGS